MVVKATLSSNMGQMTLKAADRIMIDHCLESRLYICTMPKTESDRSEEQSLFAQAIRQVTVQLLIMPRRVCRQELEQRLDGIMTLTQNAPVQEAEDTYIPS